MVSCLHPLPSLSSLWWTLLAFKKTEKSRLNDSLHLNGALTESSLSWSHDFFESVSIGESVIVKVQPVYLVLGLCPPLKDLFIKTGTKQTTRLVGVYFFMVQHGHWWDGTESEMLYVAFTQSNLTETQNLYWVFPTLTLVTTFHLLSCSTVFCQLFSVELNVGI